MHVLLLGLSRDGIQGFPHIRHILLLNHNPVLLLTKPSRTLR